MKFRCIFWVIRFQRLQKCFVRIFTIFASKNEGISFEFRMYFGSSLPASFIEKLLGAISRFMHPKMKLFAVEFRHILEVLCLQVLKEKLWAQFHDLCVQKWSCMLWSSDTFWKFSAREFYRKSCGRNSMICASKNEVVCCEIQAHFGSSRFARFMKRIRVHYHDLCAQKSNCLSWRSHAFRKFSTSKVYRESSGQIFTIYVSKNEAVCCECQTHFVSFLLARLIKKLWAHFHDLCVAQTNVLDFNIL